MEIKKLNNNTLAFNVPDGWHIKLKNGEFLKPYNNRFTAPSSTKSFVNPTWFCPREGQTLIFNGQMENIHSLLEPNGDEHPVVGFVNESGRSKVEEFIAILPPVSSYSDNGDNDGLQGSNGESYAETMERWTYERRFRNAVKANLKKFKAFVRENNIIFDSTIDIPTNEAGNLMRALINS